ncbi:MAG: hypothetical protein IKF11_10805 [Methanobrevibacter sp.]|nr:hypothetical protein [Methanobrevibacter sp.]
MFLDIVINENENVKCIRDIKCYAFYFCASLKRLLIYETSEKLIDGKSIVYDNVDSIGAK